MTTTPQDPLEAIAAKVADYIWITRYSSTASKDQVKNSILAAIREATAALTKELADVRAENERLKGYLAGTPASHVAAIFLLTNEMGHGLSSEPPVEIIRRELTLLRQDRKRLADIALSVCDSIPDSMSFGQSALRDAAMSNGEGAKRSQSTHAKPSPPQRPRHEHGTFV